MNILDNIFNFINNNTFCSIIVLIIGLIFSLHIIRKCFKLINAIIEIISAKAEEIRLKTKLAEEKENDTSGTLGYRLEVTNEIYNFVSFLVANEIVRIFEYYAYLNEPYVINKFDEDLEKICSNVFEMIKPEVFTNSDLLITKEALMSFITKRATVMFLQTMFAHNIKIRQPGFNTTDDS